MFVFKALFKFWEHILVYKQSRLYQDDKTRTLKLAHVLVIAKETEELMKYIDCQYYGYMKSRLYKDELSQLITGLWLTFKLPKAVQLECDRDDFVTG